LPVIAWVWHAAVAGFSALSLSVGCALLLTAAEVGAVDADAALLPAAPGVELVQRHCVACHSLALVASQRGDRDFWIHLIRWMQAEHNLWQLPPPEESALLDYLSTELGASAGARRLALPPHLMPPDT